MFALSPAYSKGIAFKRVSDEQVTVAEHRPEPLPDDVHKRAGGCGEKLEWTKPLLQVRDHDDLAQSGERQSFAEKAGLELERIVPHDLLAGPPSLQKVLSFDALMVGGS